MEGGAAALHNLSNCDTILKEKIPVGVEYIWGLNPVLAGKGSKFP